MGCLSQTFTGREFVVRVLVSSYLSQIEGEKCWDSLKQARNFREINRLIGSSGLLESVESQGVPQTTGYLGPLGWHCLEDMTVSSPKPA